ncbi:L,D-transpeptidase family protein [Alicyclobacillus mengziensis]|nr:L,D-transpeptidase family protein [Alicyclobacillus mengziensis]
MKTAARNTIHFLIALSLTAVIDSSSGYASPLQHVSVVVDTDEYNLTVFSMGVPVKIYQVAVGKPETPTPVGEWHVSDKQKNWGGGFGTRWIGLDVPWGTYGIHGTNKPFSIGQNMSNGCVRMHNKDVEDLYDWIQVGTTVTVIGHPLRHFRRLAVGDIGVNVWLVQSRLTSLGFYRGKIDGRFGLLTEQAVKDFERSNQLPVDGVVSLHDYHELGLEE